MRAALGVDIVYVALPEPPPAGRNTLQLFVDDELVGAVSAELVGSGRDGEYPLRVRLLDQAHAAALGGLIEQRNSLAVEGPRPRRTSIREAPPPPPSEPPPSGFGDEEKTLASRSQGSRKQATVQDRTLVSRAPHIDDEKTLTSTRLPTPVPPRTPPPPSSGTSSSPDAEVVATTVFDPDSMLRARSLNTGSLSDELTIPRSPDEPHRPRPRSIRDAFFTDDESQTLPGSSRAPGVASPDVSWNVRIAPTTKDPLCGRTIGGGKYILDSVIGTGAIGIVFKASHKDLGR
ncbi:MAG: hypothetical protein JWO86_5468, partial [Myxococcaceae bacterium]|nr:hypothetical protein [Myxococcaceae bacterium]